MQILKNTEQVGEGSTEPVDRPCSNKVKLFCVDPNHHLVEFGPFVPTFSSRNAGIFKDANTFQPDRSATASRSRSWLSVVCLSVETRK
jgi:hypothetical protein